MGLSDVYPMSNVIALSQSLLLLSQCRAISSVVIAKPMKKRKLRSE